MIIFPAGESRVDAIASRLDQFQCLLFLDIDGVLNPYGGPGGGPGPDAIDTEMVAHLNHILQNTNAGIVVSSGWRVSHSAIRAMAKAGIDQWHTRFLGVTPSLPNYTGDHSAVRWKEIQKWLQRNHWEGRFAVLDDMGLISEHPAFFQTEEEVGLTREIADQVVKHLQT